MSSTLSVRQVAERYSVSERVVRSWIAAGELRAFSVGRHPGSKKPRFRITQDALLAFEQLRTPTPRATRARRARRTGPDVIEFYK
jgi:excisionase family DNA binding protein